MDWDSYGEDNMTCSNTRNFNVTCNCSSWESDTRGVDPIAAIRIVTSAISTVGSASIILGVLLTGKLSAAEVHPLFILSVADFILAILWMIGGIVWFNPGGGGWAMATSDPHTGMCYVLALSTTVMEIVAFLLTAVYAQSALLRIKEVYDNNGLMLAENDSRKKFRHILTVIVYIVSWVLPLVVVLSVLESVVGIEITNAGCWCVLDFFNLRPDNGFIKEDNPFYKLALVHGSILGAVFVLTSVGIAVMYVATFLYARRVIKMQDDLTGNTGKKVIKSIVKRLSIFLIIFILSGLPVLFASIAVWREQQRLDLSETLDRLILYLHAMLCPLQGFLNAIVYGWSRKEFRRAVYNRQDNVRFNRGRGYESLNQANGTSAHFNSHHRKPSRRS